MAFKKLKYWFDEELAKVLANKLMVLKPNFPKNAFVKNIVDKIDDLELKDRVELIADEIHTHLGNTIPENINLLVKILGPENEEETGMFTNFYWVMPIAKYVEKYGLEHFEVSMKAIAEITKRNTGEYTIRPFLVNYPEKTLAILKDWSLNENKHIRRLSSEGVRPRLPWAKKLDQFIENPKPILPILENIKDDTSKYVQKSVANCLNDILKDNLDIGKSIIEIWNHNPTKERKWIIKHALRNLLKAHDKWAVTIIN
ncbi:DNA alkylation repair protein [Aureibaculum conchae]|uniref:DNA alkylation repair protein n=1 Tax=Aureibaculum sp. 2308TA14-22 TaxID=3108392 RepID=UPI0033913CB2